MLLSQIYDLIIKISNSKMNLVLAHDSKHGKIVFILLNKVIAIYIKLILINIKSPGYKRFFSELFKVFLNNKEP